MQQKLAAWCVGLTWEIWIFHEKRAYAQGVVGGDRNAQCKSGSRAEY